MATIKWGKPKVESVQLDGGAMPSNPTWKEMPIIKDGTAKLTSTKGSKTEAIGEGGELVDTRYGKNKYSFEFELFVKRGDTRPIEDNDGVILPQYAVRITPEDSTLEGFTMEKCAVSVEETWASNEGHLLKYTFDGLQPATGKILKPYTAN